MCAEALALGLAPPAKLKLLGDGNSNGVDVERFSPGPSDVRDRLGLPRDSPVVGFVGRLTFDKGLPELMEAFDTILASEPRAHLLLVGWFDAAEDALCADLRTRIESHPRVHCTGFVADTEPYYRAMDLMSSYLTGRLSERGAGGSGYRHSCHHHAFHWVTRLSGAGGYRSADPARLPGGHQRGSPCAASRSRKALPYG